MNWKSSTLKNTAGPSLRSLKGSTPMHSKHFSFCRYSCCSSGFSQSLVRQSSVSRYVRLGLFAPLCLHMAKVGIFLMHMSIPETRVLDNVKVVGGTIEVSIEGVRRCTVARCCSQFEIE
jgi:hypothetical protein